MREKYVYLSDMVKDLMCEVTDYVGETEHGLDPETEWPKNEAALFDDFVEYLKCRAEELRKK